MNKVNHFLNKNILLINTGSIKKKFILQKIKKLGLKIIVLNKEKNWAQPYVDYWILSDTYNHNESIENIKVFLNENPSIKINGAITFWEDDIPLLARICHDFKLTGNTLEAANNTRDKFKMQEAFRKCGLPYIKQKLLKSNNDLEKAIKQIGFPAIIKPVFGADSQFVIKVDNPEDAREAYSYALKNCTPEFDPIYKYNENLFVFQEFIAGQEFSVEAYIQHGIPHVVGIHEKTVMDHPFFLETGDYIPPRISEEQTATLIKTAEASLIVLGVRNSLAHVEIKLVNGEAKIIETASRLGGDYTYENIQDIYLFDLIKTGCEIALGINVTSKPKSPKKYILSKYFIPKTSGIVTKIRDFNELKKAKNFSNVCISKKVGDTVFIPPDGYENTGWVSAKGDSYAEIERAIDSIFEKVNIEIAPFKSYSSFGKTWRKNPFSSALIAKKEFFSKAKKIENIRKLSEKDLRSLHVGIGCNLYSDENNPIEQDLMSVGKNIEETLLQRGYRVTFLDFNNLHHIFNELHKNEIDLVFNVCERINNSSLLEPHSAAILDTLQIPYTGSNPLTLALCIDKIRVKKLLSFHDIPTPKWDYAYSMDDEIDSSLRFPLIVKPGNTDNSIGITNDSIVTNKKELNRQLEFIIEEMGVPALVEEYIEGDEYDVSIIGNDEDELEVLPLSRSVFKNMPEGYWHIYPYEAKWSTDSVYKNIVTQQPPKNISKKLASLISEIALDTYRILDCHDYGRVEVRVDEQNNPYVLELNPNPSINIGDCVPHVAELTGMNYGDFIERIIKMAIERYKNNPPYFHLQSTMI